MRQNDTTPLMDNVQDHIIKAVKERDWSLFLFFRILTNHELQRLNDEKLAQEARFSNIDIEEAVKISRAVLAPDDVSTDYFARLDSDLFNSMPDERKSTSAPFLDFLKKLLGTLGPGNGDKLKEIFREIEVEIPSANPGEEWFRRGLLGICVHEALRYEQGPGAGRTGAGLLRSGNAEPPISEYSSAAVNISFHLRRIGGYQKGQGAR